MSLLMKIDDLRDEAARLAKASRENGLTPEEVHNYRCTLEGVEAKIDKLLMQYIALPDCPWCFGKLETTPTGGVIQCEKCLALSIPGRQYRSMIVGPNKLELEWKP